MGSLSRRDFLVSLAALGAAGAVFHPFRMVLGTQTPSRNWLIVAGGDFACLVDLEKQTLKTLPIGYNAHSFMPHPAGGLRFIGIEKWGPNATDLDFASGKTRPLNSGEGYHFYGHGIYSPDHKNVFITRVDHKTGLGHLVGYDPESHEILNDFQVTPGGLHECQRLPDGSMMVTSSGISSTDYANPQLGKRQEASALKRVDLGGSGEVIGQLAIEDDHQILGHFTVTGKGQILALSGPAPGKSRHGYLYYSPAPTESLRRLTFDPALESTLIGEMLSVALNQDQTRAAVTNPASKTSILVDMEEGKVLNFVQFNQKTSSIAFDTSRNQFLTGSIVLKAIDEGFEHQEPFTLTHSNASMPAIDGAHSLVF